MPKRTLRRPTFYHSYHTFQAIMYNKVIEGKFYGNKLATPSDCKTCKY
jgi:hypothetical protein